MVYTDLLKEVSMTEEELREQAIKRYETGESPKEIYQSLGKSKAWFFKWLKRSHIDGQNWAILKDPVGFVKRQMNL